MTWPLTLVASAHPLGNFTINHLAKIQVAQGRLQVRYILDIAEIPTFQIMHQRPDGAWNDTIMRDWARRETAVVTGGLQIRADGTPIALQLRDVNAALRPGAGGLPILRWVGQFEAPLPQSGALHHISINDYVYADRRIGWKDIIAGSQTEPTDELQRYPSALIGTPRRINAATFTVSSAGLISNISEQNDTQPVAGPLTSWIAPTVLSGMFTQPNQSALFIILTMLAAFGLGALHAIEPGHGKALLAFTLVGARATGKQALILAGSLTFAHTIGVLLLGVVLFFAADFVSESIYPWITLASGAVIASSARVRSRVSFERGAAWPINHDHGHEHSHEHGHSHALPGSQPLGFGSAVWAAMSGGIAPCPAAIVVLLAALRLHHLAYGMVLIVIFSFGLATVLSALGLGVVHGAAWLSRRSGYARIAPFGPLISAIVISTIGAWMLAQGFIAQGVAAPALLIAALTLAAIAGYALAQQGHTHTHAHGAHEAAPV